MGVIPLRCPSGTLEQQDHLLPQGKTTLCPIHRPWPTPAAFVGSHVKGGKRKEGITAGRWWVEGWWGHFLVKIVQPLLVGTDSTPLIDYPG